MRRKANRTGLIAQVAAMQYLMQCAQLRAEAQVPQSRLHSGNRGAPKGVQEDLKARAEAKRERRRLRAQGGAS